LDDFLNAPNKRKPIWYNCPIKVKGDLCNHLLLKQLLTKKTICAVNNKGMRC
jgi:exoribonuclease II